MLLRSVSKPECISAEMLRACARASGSLVRDGRIQYVGARGAVPVPAGATVVNLNGRTIIPGLINTHGHVGSVGGPGRENLTKQLRLYAEYGITTVNSLGGEGPDAIALRNEQSMTGLDRARVFAAGAVVAGRTVDAALAASSSAASSAG